MHRSLAPYGQSIAYNRNMASRPDTSFEAVCLPLLADCYAFALSLARHGPDAEDLVQDTFLKAQRAFASFEPGTNAKAWLFTILKRIHIDRYRRRRLQPVALPEEELVEMGRPPAPAEVEALDALSPAEVRAAVERIPDPFRLPVRLRDLDGLSYREIAEILDIPPGTVMSRLFRGREWLRRLLVDPIDAPRGADGPPGPRSPGPSSPRHLSPREPRP